jgi:hypothetical protein
MRSSITYAAFTEVILVSNAGMAQTIGNEERRCV